MKKTVKKLAILSTVIAVILSGCASDNKTTTEADLQPEEEKEEVQDSSEGNNYAFTPLIIEEGNYGGVYEQDKTSNSYKVKYQAVILDEDTGKIYPELAETLIKEKDSFFTIAGESLNDFKESSESDYYDDMEMIDENSISVLRADCNVLSLKRDGYIYTGGAHGEAFIEGICYDSRTGNKLELKDVISDSELLVSVAEEKINETYGEELEFYDNLENAIKIAMGEEKSEYGSGVSFALSYNYIEIYFDTYTLGSHADGRQIIKIDFKEYPGLVRDEFTKNIPYSYAYKLDKYGDLIYEDIDQDGKNEKINIHIEANRSESEYQDEYILKTVIDGNEHMTEFFSYMNQDIYYVKNDEGSSYIYLFTSHDNDYINLNVCRLTKNGVFLNEAGNFEPGIIKSEYIDWETNFPNSYLTTNNEISYALTNPAYLMLSSRLEALSTYYGYRACYADSNGIPQSNALYEIRTDAVFSLKKSFKLEVCYANGKRTGKEIELPAGTELVPYKTDGATEIIFICGDDKYVIGDIDISVYPQLINNVPSDEVFDGQIYAG